jgi:hypothetical protein
LRKSPRFPIPLFAFLCFSPAFRWGWPLSLHMGETKRKGSGCRQEERCYPISGGSRIGRADAGWVRWVMQKRHAENYILNCRKLTGCLPIATHGSCQKHLPPQPKQTSFETLLVVDRSR